MSSTNEGSSLPPFFEYPRARRSIQSKWVPTAAWLKGWGERPKTTPNCSLPVSELRQWKVTGIWNEAGQRQQGALLGATEQRRPRTEVPGANDPEGTEIEVIVAEADEVSAKAGKRVIFGSMVFGRASRVCNRSGKGDGLHWWHAFIWDRLH